MLTISRPNAICVLLTLVLVIVPIGPRFAFATVLDLNDITRAFYSETESQIRHDIIFCGNFTSDLVDYAFAESYQFAIQSEDWILENPDGLNETQEINGNSIILYFTPSTLENFYSIIGTISDFVAAEANTSTIRSNRRIFLVSWPQEIDDSKNYTGSTDYATRFLVNEYGNNSMFSNIVRKVRQNEEVYILIWQKMKPNTKTKLEDRKPTKSSYTYKFDLLDIIEIYGIMDEISIIQSLILDFDANPDVDVIMEDINTTELMRFAARRKNFRNVTFNVVAQRDEGSDFEVKIEVTNGTVEFTGGSSYSMLKDFQYMLRFRYKAILGNGSITEGADNKSLTGVGHQIINRDADICISTSTLEVYRASYIHFLQPVVNEKSFIFFLQPSVNTARNVFTMPFTWALWYNIGIVWLGIIIFGSFIVHKKNGSFRHIGTSKMFSKYKKEQEDFDSEDVFVWAIGVLCQQGWSTNPMKVSTRIVFLTAMMTSVLLYAYYTAAFVAAVSSPIIPIRNFEDIRKLQYQVVIDPASPAILIAYVGESEGNKITAMSNNYFKNESQVIQKVLEDGSKIASILGADAFFSIGSKSHNDSDLCRVFQLKPNGSARVQDSMIVRQGSPYKEIFGHKTIMLIERGLQSRYEAEYVRQTQLKCNPAVSINLELEFLECYLAFVILFFGFFIAAITSWVERRYHLGLYETRKQMQFFNMYIE